VVDPPLTPPWRGTGFHSPSLEGNRISFPLSGGEPDFIPPLWRGTGFHSPSLEGNLAPL